MSLREAPARHSSLEGTPRVAFTVAEFCSSHRISRTTFYQLLNAGIGPRIMKVGVKTLISAESAAAWRTEREAACSQGPRKTPA